MALSVVVLLATGPLTTQKHPTGKEETHGRGRFADLLKAALRHRPDRIIVGEIRGSEARVYLDALNTGHSGSISTIHANSAGDALRRLAHLAMRDSGGAHLEDLEEECQRSIDVVVHVARNDDLRAVKDIVRFEEISTEVLTREEQRRANILSTLKWKSP